MPSSQFGKKDGGGGSEAKAGRRPSHRRNVSDTSAISIGRGKHSAFRLVSISTSCNVILVLVGWLSPIPYLKSLSVMLLSECRTL